MSIKLTDGIPQPTSARPTRVGKRFPVSSGPSQPPQQAKMLRERLADGVRYSGGDPVEPEEVEGIRIANEIDPANGSAGAGDGQEQGAEPASDGTTVEPEPEVNATVQPGTKQLE
jgi:hypothetical protein